MNIPLLILAVAIALVVGYITKYIMASKNLSVIIAWIILLVAIIILLVNGQKLC